MDRTVAKYRREVGLPDSSDPQFRTMEVLCDDFSSSCHFF